MISVLFVCLGNICRSPMAEGVFRELVRSSAIVDHVHIDSAGTSDYHLGAPPDARAVAVASRRGIDLSGLRGRQVVADDLERFDYLLVMDRGNLSQMQQIATGVNRYKIRLLMEFSEDMSRDEIPDPYYGEDSGFERVLDMIESGARGLLAEIERQLAGKSR